MIVCKIRALTEWIRDRRQRTGIGNRLPTAGRTKSEFNLL